MAANDAFKFQLMFFYYIKLAVNLGYFQSIHILVDINGLAVIAKPQTPARDKRCPDGGYHLSS